LIDGYTLVPNYSYIGERIYGNLINPKKRLEEGDLLNYKTLFTSFKYYEEKFAETMPHLFNFFAYKAYHRLQEENLSIINILEKNPQLLTKKEKQTINKQNASNSKTTKSRFLSFSRSKGSTS
jgi:hypothetical protein